MKKLAVLAALTIMSLSAFAQKAVVANNNWDSEKPIFYQTAGGALPTQDVFVQLLGGATGSTLAPVADQSGATIFKVDPDGHYDAGVGIVPGLTATGAASFELRAWTGGATYDAATYKGTTGVFAGTVNGWNDAAVPPAAPNGATLTIPSSIVMTTVVPEPSTLALGLLGAAALLIRRRK